MQSSKLAEKGIEVVAHIGVAGSGKDYRSEQYVEKGYVRVDFKDALLDMASDLVGYDVREDYDWFKEHIIGVRRPEGHFSEAFAVMDTRELKERFPKIMTGRRLLQRLGTDVMRKRDPKYWVKQFMKSAEDALFKGSSVVCADCRFPNEIQGVLELMVPTRFVFCDYRSERYNPNLDHESERLAQELLKSGLKDGEKIALTRLTEILKANFLYV